MTRLPAWPELLHAYVESRREMPFAWAKNDCGVFAADGVLLYTGEDIAAPYRGRYTSEIGAARLIKKAGGMRAMLPQLPEVARGFAQRGDVVIGVIEGRETFGLVVGEGRWCAPGLEGLVFRPMSDVATVLKV